MNVMRPVATAFAAFVGATSLIACAGATNEQSTATATPIETPAQAPPGDSASNPVVTDGSAGESATAPAALQFSAAAVGGGTIDFTEFAGQTVAMWFWAPT